MKKILSLLAAAAIVSTLLPDKAAVRWWDYTPINAGTGSNTPAVQNGPLDFQVDVSDVAAGNNLDTYTGGTAQMIIRSNAPYTLTGNVTATSGFGSVAAGDIALADIGYGVANLANSGARVFGDPAGGSTITAGFGSEVVVILPESGMDPSEVRRYRVELDRGEEPQAMAPPPATATRSPS